MSDPRYLRNDIHSLLAHVTEECGEVLAAIGKTLRWGLDSVNPELPPEQQETNRDWVLRELCDLELTVARLRIGLAAQPRPAERCTAPIHEGIAVRGCGNPLPCAEHPTSKEGK